MDYVIIFRHPGGPLQHIIRNISTPQDGIDFLKLNQPDATVIKTICMTFTCQAERKRVLPDKWWQNLEALCAPTPRGEEWSFEIVEGVSAYGAKNTALSTGKNGGKGKTVEQEVDEEVAKVAAKRAAHAPEKIQASKVGKLVLKQTYAQKRALAIKYYLKRKAKQARKTSKQARIEAVR